MDSPNLRKRSLAAGDNFTAIENLGTSRVGPVNSGWRGALRDNAARLTHKLTARYNATDFSEDFTSTLYSHRSASAITFENRPTHNYPAEFNRRTLAGK